MEITLDLLLSVNGRFRKTVVRKLFQEGPLFETGDVELKAHRR